MRSYFLPACVGLACFMAAAWGRAETIQWRKVDETPGFPGLQGELKSIVERRGGPRIATMCVVLRQGGGAPLVFALWPAAHLLYRWGPTRDPQLSDATLVLHEPLDLRRDIVRTAADRLSTYKVSRAWVDDVIEQCRAHGETMRIVGRPR